MYSAKPSQRYNNLLFLSQLALRDVPELSDLSFALRTRPQQNSSFVYASRVYITFPILSLPLPLPLPPDAFGFVRRRPACRIGAACGSDGERALAATTGVREWQAAGDVCGRGTERARGPTAGVREPRRRAQWRAASQQAGSSRAGQVADGSLAANATI